MSRKAVFTVAVFALLCAGGASAAAAPAATVTLAAPLALPAAGACPHAALFPLSTPAPVATPALPNWLQEPAGEARPPHFRGYCACECSTIKDCNVDADCSNNRCSTAISCC